MIVSSPDHEIAADRQITKSPDSLSLLSHNCGAVAALLSGRSVLATSGWSFRICGQAFAELAGAVAVDDADLLLIGDEGLVEKLRDAIDRLIDGAANDVELAEQAFTGPQIDIHADFRRGAAVFPGDETDAQLLDPRLQTFAAHVDVGLLAVDGDDDAFQAERADRDSRADNHRAGIGRCSG